MKITYAFRHMDSNDHVRDHAAAKLERLERFEDREMMVEVVFTEEKYLTTAEFKLSGAHGTFVLSETREDVKEAIDVAVDKLDQVLSRDKDKRKHHKGHQSITPHEG